MELLEASQAWLELIKSTSRDGGVASQSFVAYSVIVLTILKYSAPDP